MKRNARTQVACIGPRKAKSLRSNGSGAAVLLTVVLVAGCGGITEEDPPAVAIEPSRLSGSATTDPAPQPSGPVEDSTGPGEADARTQGPVNEPEGSGEDEAVEDVVIVISDFEYTLPDTIAPGSEVTIRNEDRVGHTVTSDEEGMFDVIVGGGQEETFTVPEEAGEYSFFCKPHPNMIDTLVIG